MGGASQVGFRLDVGGNGDLSAPRDGINVGKVRILFRRGEKIKVL